MKKTNVYFIGECIIIVLLLLIIGILIKDKSDTTMGKGVDTQERNVVVVGEEEFSQSHLEEEMKVENTAEELPAEELVNQQEQASKVQEEQTVVKEGYQRLEKPLEVVVFGDSIWNDGRGSDGISEQVMEQINAKIYNCAIGGTTAAVINDESTAWDNWTSKSFNGMMYIATGAVDAEDLIADDAAYEEIRKVDFSKIDYVIVSYGLNDYFSDVPIYPQEYYDVTSYVGALRHGITKLKEEYPDLKIILTSPTYCGWFQGERQFELGTYVENARSVAEEMDAYFLDMYHAFGKNPEEKVQYLEDGVHLTSEGRSLYANSVVAMLNELEETKETE